MKRRATPCLQGRPYEAEGDPLNKPETETFKKQIRPQKSRDKSHRDLSRFDFLCLRWFCFTASTVMPSKSATLLRAVVSRTPGL